MVHTSTVGCLGLPSDGSPCDETTPVSRAELVGHYKKSKYDAEQAALGYARSGLDLVIVNPSTPVGPGDVKPTPTGRIILDFLNGKMPAYVDTGLNLIAVEDVALAAACASSLCAQLTGREPSIPIEGVLMSRKKMFFSSEKAIRELGLPSSSVESALEGAARWYIDNGYVKGGA